MNKLIKVVTQSKEQLEVRVWDKGEGWTKQRTSEPEWLAVSRCHGWGVAGHAGWAMLGRRVTRRQCIEVRAIKGSRELSINGSAGDEQVKWRWVGPSQSRRVGLVSDGIGFLC